MKHNTAFLTPSRSVSASDSEESSTNNECYTNTNLTLVAEFDDIMRHVKHSRNNEVEDAFLQFVEQTAAIFDRYQEAVKECRRLQEQLDRKTHEFGDLESKLLHARRLLDKEKMNTRRAEEERDSTKIQLAKVRDMLFKEVTIAVPQEAREKFSFLKNESYSSDGAPGHLGHLSDIQEINSTGSLLSDLSYSRSEDDLDRPFEKTWKKHRPSTGGLPEPAFKKRRSSSSRVVEINKSETVRATTTVTVSKEGPITATSVIESLPQEPTTPKRKTFKEPEECPEETATPVAVSSNWPKVTPIMRSSVVRQHVFQQKAVVLPENCGPCAKKIKFGRMALKCKDCRGLCHPECKDDLPLPCIPQTNTPTNRALLGYIGDFTPTSSPMVPAIIQHCLNEIEHKGLNEIGIYRIPGSERDVKALKERFLRGKGAPCLSQIDIHVICGTVKDFLRSLQEPLVTYGLWKDFAEAVQARDEQDIAPALYQVISELPQPNRDTLAYMILHLKRVAEAKECKMPLENLAKIFGPTLIGYSNPEPTPSALFSETTNQFQVMESLLKLPESYWLSFINTNNNVNKPIGKLQQTPSTDSLLRPTTARNFFTPSVRKRIKGKRFLTTPPAMKK